MILFAAEGFWQAPSTCVLKMDLVGRKGRLWAPTPPPITVQLLFSLEAKNTGSPDTVLSLSAQ